MTAVLMFGKWTRACMGIVDAASLIKKPNRFLRIVAKGYLLQNLSWDGLVCWV